MAQRKLLSAKQQAIIDKAVAELDEIEEKYAGCDPPVVPIPRQSVWELISHQLATV